MSRADQGVLSCRHMERMEVRRMLMAEVCGKQMQDNPGLGWMDGVKVALGSRGITVGAARQ